MFFEFNQGFQNNLLYFFGAILPLFQSQSGCGTLLALFESCKINF